MNQLKTKLADAYSAEKTSIDRIGLTEPLTKKETVGFEERGDFLKNLFNTHQSDFAEAIDNPRVGNAPISSQPTNEGYMSIGRIHLEPWRTIENIPSRVVQISEEIVVLECLVDSENKKYEERIFLSSLFKGIPLSEGKYLYLRFLERSNELKIQVHDDKNLISKDDFPSESLVEKYKDHRLFRK